MNRDTWTNTRTGVELGSAVKWGNPRSWLKRAWDAHNKELELHPTTHEPGKYTVGAIWYRPAQLPHFDYDHLIRWFEAPTENTIHKRDPKLVAAVGYGFVVPSSQIMPVLEELRQLGANWIWWDFSRDSNERKIGSLRPLVKLDHKEIFKLLDEGRTQGEISRIFNTSSAAIGYVAKKWRGEKVLRDKDGDQVAFTPEQQTLYSICCDVIDGFDDESICDEYGLTIKRLEEIKRTYGVKGILNGTTRTNDHNVAAS